MSRTMATSASVDLPVRRHPSPEHRPGVGPDGIAMPAAPAAFQPLSIRRNAAWTLGGNFVLAGCQWGILVVLAKLGTPELVGRFALASAVCAPVFMLASLNLRAVQVTDAARRFRFGDYMALRWILLAGALAAVGALSLAAGYGTETAAVVLLLASARTFEFVGDVFHGLFQQRERMDFAAKSRMLKGVLSLSALGAGVFLTGDLAIGLIGFAAAWAVLLILYDLPRGIRILVPDLGGKLHASGAISRSWTAAAPRWKPDALRRLAWLALPLGFAAVAYSLGVNIPRYFVAHYHGEKALGFFAPLACAVVAMDLFAHAIGTSGMPRLARYFLSDRRAFLTSLLKFEAATVAVGAAAVSLAALAGRPLLELVFTAEYGAQASLLTAVTVVGMISAAATVLSLATTAAGLYRTQFVVYLVNVLIVSGTVVWLVPTEGLRGAAWALGASALFRLAAYIAVLVVVLRRPVGKPSAESVPAPPCPQA